MRLWMIMLVLVLSATACGDGDSSTPTAPTPGPTPAPTPTPPASTAAALSGTVSNTSGQRIGGARITVLDGPNSGQSVETNGNGEYRFDSLTIANANFSANASGYLEDRRGVRIDGTSTLNFTLTPVPPSITITARIVSGGPGVAQEWAFVAKGSVSFTSYDWDFGDGNTASNADAEEQHLYGARGKFTVKVTGRRANGEPVVGTLEIEVL
jgi:PKD repeat protein